jgi:uncharacterized protein (TIRG00374 family)
MKKNNSELKYSPKLLFFIVLGLLLFVIYLNFFVGFDEIFNVIKQINLVQYAIYYFLAFIAILSSTFFYSLTWRELLITTSIDIKIRNAFQYCLIANFIDLTIPLEAVSGEITKIYLIKRETSSHTGNVVASIVSHRIISDTFALIALTLSSIVLVNYIKDSFILYLLAFFIGGTALTIIILSYISVKARFAEKLFYSLLKLKEIVTRRRTKMNELKEQAKKNASFFHLGIKKLVNYPRKVMKSVLFTAISWFSHLAIYFFVFLALGYSNFPLFIPLLIVVFSISLAVQTISFVLPVGLVEIVMTSLYILSGIPPALGGTATALIRIVTFWFQIIVGFAVAQWIGIRNLSSVSRT